MQKIDSSNTLFTLASDLVNHTFKNIFLTGRAGTGKTTFLKYIRENCPKQMAVVAPTGVAAINAGGVTIHSFFQLPFSPFIPEAKGFIGRNEEITNKHTLLGRLRLNTERRKIMQELELLVIDEISMVRCDVLDAIDLVLRHVRFRHSERFGGVQVLFIGDMFQLPPVVKEQEWTLLRDYYKSPYFFDSHVMKEDPPVYVEFTKIYRQTEENFINLLNKIRNNEMDEEHFYALHDRYQPDFFGGSSDGYILLTTHNEKARQINNEEMSKLPGKIFTYKAEVVNDFPATAFPADELLQLKVGAQVMFIKNDTDKARQYFNGKIGVVTELENDKILVQCKNEPAPIEVSKETWENIRYTFDKSTRQLNEDVLGSFSQYPLRLAWAITIHKSQGLTFEKAVIDAGKAFAPGQVYVALSRCTNLEGMVLHSKINPGSLFADNRIVQFTKNILPVEELQQELVTAKKAYQEKVLSSLFDFRKQVNGVKELQAYLLKHSTSFNAEVFTWADDLLNKFVVLQTTAEKFQMQLKRLFELTEKTEENTTLQERLKTAANWFSNEIKSIVEYILQSPAITDSTIHAKEYNELLRETYVQSALQNFMLQGFSGKFNMENFHHRKKSFVAPSFGINAYAGASEKKVELAHPALYYQLKKLRDVICSKKNLPIYFVASSNTLEEMTIYLPQTLEELEQISGFGKSKVETYGDEFLSIIKAYSLENNLTSNISEKIPKRKRKETKGPKVDTKAETFRLYKLGKGVTEIANERNLAAQTIEGHLAHYVQNGLIKIEELVSREKLVLIEPEIKNFNGGSIAPIKEKLGNKASWGEIRLVMAWAEYHNSSPHVDH
ncbi:MAG TPA: helix-turn-helix domain-containing protein [Flavisolibacter sp.]|nr:helix-turn-helix domain-containing protein [Flavisolibacter sp.]